MDRKRTLGLGFVILFGLNAMTWIADCLQKLPYDRLSFMQVVCAVCWTIIFIIKLRQYLNHRAEEKE